MKEKQVSTWVKALIRIIASGLGTGLSPIAPGTCGSILAVLIIYLLKDVSKTHYVILTLIVTLFSVWICHKSLDAFGKRDAPQIVIDEIAGMMITMIGIPITTYWLVVGLLLFRFFDITKLPPANWIDSKLKNGWGVVLDDVIAGIYSNLILLGMLSAKLE